MNTKFVRELTRLALVAVTLGVGGPQTFADNCPTITLSPATLPNVGLACATHTWRPTGSMTMLRRYHTATVLKDGSVLVAGGYADVDSLGVADRYLATAEIYDPATGTWTATGSMSARRAHHTATLLADGKVLVAGGSSLDGGYGLATSLASAELYDPATGTWMQTGSLIIAVADHTATLLKNGKVLVAGGAHFNAASGGSASLPESFAELYDPATGTWWPTSTSMTGFMEKGGAVLLPDGKVLASGDWPAPATASIYDPVTDTWTAASAPASLFQTLTLLPNGKVLGAGGCQVYDPGADTWTTTAPMNGSGVKATLLTTGKVLVSGGSGYAPVNTSELYDAETDTWQLTGPLTATRASHQQVLLNDGSVLACGGLDNSSAELYVQLDLSASGGARPCTFAITAGSAPAGLTLNSDGTWTGVPYNLGTNSFTVTATDVNGCTGSASYTVVVIPTGSVADTNGPQLTIWLPADHKKVASSAMTVSGAARDIGPVKTGVALVLYSLNGGQQQLVMTTNNFTNWSAAITLQPGWNTFTAQAFDYRGNASPIVSRSYLYGSIGNVAGSYNGLFYETNGTGEPVVKEQSAGAIFNLNVHHNGVYTGSLYLAGAKYMINGTFDLSGHSSVVVARGTLASVSVSLQLDWSGMTKQITGTVSCAGEGWSSPLQADFCVYNGLNRHPAARYTMVIPPGNDAPANSPGGYGYGVIGINPMGTIIMAGALADSSAISQSIPVSKDARWPLYVDLYKHQGLLEGWVDFSSGVPAGQVTWIKPSNPVGVPLTTYRAGFTNSVQVFGSPYAPQMPAIIAADATMEITDGSGLNLPLTFNAQISANNQLQKLSNTPTNALKGSVIPATGLLNLQFQPTNVKGAKAGVGVVLQNSNTAYGAFIGNDDGTGKTNTGAIYLH